MRRRRNSPDEANGEVPLWIFNKLLFGAGVFGFAWAVRKLMGEFTPEELREGRTGYIFFNVTEDKVYAIDKSNNLQEISLDVADKMLRDAVYLNEKVYAVIYDKDPDESTWAALYDVASRVADVEIITTGLLRRDKLREVTAIQD